MNILRGLALGLVMISSSSAIASPKCTTEPKEKWMKKEEAQAKIKHAGYTIRKFGTEGSCYEVKGTNAKGEKVEAYFNPVDAVFVSEKKD